SQTLLDVRPLVSQPVAHGVLNLKCRAARHGRRFYGRRSLSASAASMRWGCDGRTGATTVITQRSRQLLYHTCTVVAHAAQGKSREFMTLRRALRLPNRRVRRLPLFRSAGHYLFSGERNRKGNARGRRPTTRMNNYKRESFFRPTDTLGALAPNK